MWLPWLKIAGNKSKPVSFSLCSVASFSFKDIDALLADEHPTSPPDAPSTVFLRILSTASALRSSHQFPPAPPPLFQPLADDDRIVLYYTSLRVIRHTFEVCRAVRSILRGFRVAIDERDLSMDARFLAELEGILGGRKRLTLPLVFIGGRLIGGADEIWRLNETGELKKFLEGLPSAAPGACQRCGSKRFAFCPICNGSHKCSDEKGCAACNENGLAGCPHCSL